MMDRKWTPGKWSVYQVERETYWPGIDAGRTSIVIWGDQQENNGVQGDTLDEAKANAYLIAASPDLYEALEELESQEYSGHSNESLEMEVRLGNQYALLILKCRAALAKARGETQ